MEHKRMMLGLERTTKALKRANDALERRVKRPTVIESQVARGVSFEIVLLPRPLPPHTFSVRQARVEVKGVNFFDHPRSVGEAWELAKLTYDGLLESAAPPRQAGTVIDMPAFIEELNTTVAEAQPG